MRIHKNVRMAIGFFAMYMALSAVRGLIPDLRVYRIYDPEVVAGLILVSISFYGVWWGFRKRQDPNIAKREIQGEWPEEKQVDRRS
jgi:hypothetical protein